MSEPLWLDYESRSRCDLKAHGAYNYCKDPSTEVICLAYAFGDEDVELWWPNKGPFPKRVADYFAGEGLIYAHNSSFDRLLTWYVVCPDFNIPEPVLDR